MKCYIDKPYPKVQVERKSDELASILSHLYASEEGELTAIHQYSYQSFITLDDGINKILESISIVEMHHLELLGKTIYLLGKDPIFGEWNKKNICYWNSDYVYYDTDLKTMLEIDIEKEKKAISNYQMVLQVIEDEFVKKLIKRILEDEYLHLEIFMKLRQKYS